MSKKAAILYLVLTLVTQISFAQQAFNQDPTNPNLDFSSNDFSHWNISWGDRLDGPYETAGMPQTPMPLVSHLVQGIYGSNYDGLAGPGNLPRVPSGLTQVARLGVPMGGGYGFAKAYAMSYNITVNADYPILYFQIASVMDRSHTNADNTHFKFQIRDQNDSILTQPCGGFRMYPKGGTIPQQAIQNLVTIPSFGHDLIPYYGSVLYHPWQSIAMDMTAYIGQTISIEFEHYDCYTGYHGSYSFASAAMRNPYDTVYFCKGASTAIIPGHPRFKSYNWSNGDTSQDASIQNPVDGASYTCTVGSFNGCSATFTYILKEDPTTIDFNYASGSCNEVFFSDNSSSPLGPVSDWNWQFGDSFFAPDDTSSVQNPSFVYNSLGNYNVNFSINSPIGCTYTVSKVIEVVSQSTNDFTVSNVCFGDSTQFTDISLGNNVSYQWSFGDGNASVLSNPTHYYSNTGNYTVTLIIENSSGCFDTIVKQIELFSVPAASFTTEDLLCTDQNTIFTNNSSNATNYSWTFGNGDSSFLQNPTVIYELPNTYTVTLVAANEHGCRDSVQQQFIVHLSPTAAFQASPVVTSLSNPDITFINQSAGENTWFWDFGNGENSSQENPVHTYNEGDYDVILVVYNEFLCTDTAQTTVSINQETIIPNILTPNGDGANDLFIVHLGSHITSYEIRIFNRWGSEVFVSFDKQVHWNGQVNGTYAEDGVYFYYIKTQSLKNETKEYDGFLTLLK